MKKTIISLCGLLSLLLALPGLAAIYPLPPVNSNIVGHLQTAVVKPGESFAQIARDYDVGYMELLEANPAINPKQLAAGTVLIIPTEYILPNALRKGIVVNVAEMRLYYYPPDKHEVVTFPIGIGREGEATPLGKLTVIQRIKDPQWVVPKSIKAARAAEGIELPDVMPPGPNNPLGKYALRLSNWSYLIHGTSHPLEGIGRRSSAGCLRLYPEDIKLLYHRVAVNTPVNIVDEPYKIGWRANQVYLEAHEPLQETEDTGLLRVKNYLKQQFAKRNYEVNWPEAQIIAQEQQGLPQAIGNLS